MQQCYVLLGGGYGKHRGEGRYQDGDGDGNLTDVEAGFRCHWGGTLVQSDPHVWYSRCCCGIS